VIENFEYLGKLEEDFKNVGWTAFLYLSEIERCKRRLKTDH
jgi:hypothetical protein